MSQSVPALTLGAVAVRQHNGLFSLNDLHKAAGAARGDQPAFFLRRKETQALLAELNSANSQSLETKPGRDGGTYACRELVIAYAAWINAAFHLKVIRVFLDAATALPSPDTYTVQPRQSLTADQAHALRTTIEQGAQHLPKDLQARFVIQAWSKLKAHFGCSYRDIPSPRFAEAMNLVLRHIGEFDHAPALAAPGLTVQELCERLALQLQAPNGVPLTPFLPLWQAINQKLAGGYRLGFSSH